MKAKNDAEALAKAEKAAEEQKLLREQETAKKHALEEEKRKQAAAEFARRRLKKSRSGKIGAVGSRPEKKRNGKSLFGNRSLATIW
ncbi:hypothetical protein LWM68_32860 [Niabella sp. W65]|nr:hypothetical protein [Niabella sp. W65]MCH7367125.1 hypothetical protein [Niabella sp. W65]ULT42801.1 hypothetical protein KRR40_04390 [Niabella sp. I65]